MKQPVASPYVHYESGMLYVENRALFDLAKEFGTPLYVYSKAALQAAWQSWQVATAHRNTMVCYGMKANSNLAVLQLFAQWGAGFDIVSGGELQRCLKAGARPDRIVFSGVGKQAWEIELALNVGIFAFNVESMAELVRIADVAARLKKEARVSFRVNPDVDAKTHPYISTGLKENKFGIDLSLIEQAATFAASAEYLNFVGLDCHIGSQITEVAPFLDALERLCHLLLSLKRQGHHIHHLDLGGGVGIRYTDEQPIDLKQYVALVFDKLEQFGLGDLKVLFEPGRSLVGNAGVLLTTVQYLKSTQDKQFAIVDAAMNDLLRPTLYQAYHQILPVCDLPREQAVYDVVGPVCETGDWLGKDRCLAVAQDDVLAVMSAGAYSFSMASQYNSRPRAMELLVDGSHVHVIRKRETLEDLWALECLL